MLQVKEVTILSYVAVYLVLVQLVSSAGGFHRAPRVVRGLQ